MNGSFWFLKSKFFKIRLVKSVLAALFCGCVSSGLLLLLFDTGIIVVAPIYSIPVGIAVALIAFLFFFLLIRRSDEAIAAEIDERFRLQEKVVTMLEFKKEKGALVELQRNDASSALAKVPMNRILFKRFWIYILAFVLGVTTLVFGILLIPQKSVDPPEPERAFAISDKQIAQLRDLISDVRDSGMENPYKEEIAGNLETLLTDLMDVKLHKEMIERVTKSIKEIKEITDNSECASELYESFVSNEDSTTDIVAEYLKTGDWTKYSEISKKLIDALKAADESSAKTEEEKLTVIKNKVATTAAYISLSLAYSGVDENEELYKAMAKIVNVNERNDIIGENIYGLSLIASKAMENGYDRTVNDVKNLVNVMQTEIYTAMEPKAVNIEIGTHASDKLYSIFGITKPQSDDEEKEGDNSAVKPDDEKGDGASAGDGHKYPTNDKVYDINSGEQVIYGNLWALYYGEINNLDDEEKKEIYNKYFMILYNGFDENKGSENTDNKGE